MRPKLSSSEKKILRRIRRWLPTKTIKHQFISDEIVPNYVRYDFWFTYIFDKKTSEHIADGWEGGFELSQNDHFRNQYSLIPGKPIRQNW